jgi:phospholipase C
MKGAGLRMTVAGCVIGAGCMVGIPALVRAQATAAAAAQGTEKQDDHSNDHRDDHRDDHSNDHNTRTPIKHVIYIIGENRTFDHLFAAYVPRDGQTVWNLLSEGIINADGTPGPHWKRAQQWKATDTKEYSPHPEKTGPYSTLPPINTDGAPTKAPFQTVAEARDTEPALLRRNDVLLTTGGTGQAADVDDARFPLTLPDRPFQVSRYTSYDSYTSSPVHRFYQMWQQTDCDITKATKRNPSGCQSDLFPWVEVQTGTGGNGTPLPAGFNDETTGEGATSMGFFNVQAGDVPYFTKLAREFAMSDNFHQAVEGGTGANHIALGFGTLIYYADSTGAPVTPPSNQIENPNPQTGTNNWYTEDGYGGGSYVGCADAALPGIGPVREYLKSLPYETIRNDCRKGAYYLVNNYNPGYLGTGAPAPLGANVFTIPPTTQNNLGLLLADHHISWKYYGEGWANGTETGEASTYCNICNPFLYSKQIMTNPNLRKNLQDITNLYDDIEHGTLPAVSIVKPDGYLDGHPASSKWDLFEGFTKKIVEMVKKNPELFKETAIMITADEGGGYYDSGYIQPLDFFGDGTRIPLLVVSPYSKGVGLVHSYGDHISFDKFVEANWGLETLAHNSRDNLPNPVTARDNPYAPVNAPAISDLMDMFDFSHHDHDGHR